jgi:HSP20 family protein
MTNSTLQKKDSNQEERFYAPLLFARDFQRQLGDFWRGMESFEVPAFTSEWVPAADIVETDNDYEITLEAPGMPKENVKISFANGVLSVTGEKKAEEKKDTKRFHRVERSYGYFERNFRLPASVQADKIKADFKDGLLKVTVPKSEEVKPKQIDIKVS